MGKTIFKGGEMTININKPEIKELHPRILVLGIGGAGGNAINGMIEAGLQGVEFIAVNTDAQDLNLNKAKAKIQIGSNITRGLGAGARLDIGQAAADESLNDIINFLQGANMVFITAGMGGGTGTGAAHVIARAAKELNILTVGVITLPFLYEGPSRMRRANQGLEELRKHVDTIIVVPNQNLFKVANENTTLEESFVLSNNVLKHGVQSITDLMVKPGLINLDFADVESIMKSMGKAMMGTGEAEGEKRALQSAELALNNPLIDEYSLQGAKGLLVNITGGKDLKLFEVEEAVNKVRAEVDPEAELIIGSITDNSLEGKMRVSIVATSLDGISPEEKSVVSMVHRIQNRNSGYSNPAINPNLDNVVGNDGSLNSTSIHGANALKINHNLEKENVLVEQNGITIQEDIHGANALKINHNLEKENVSVEQNSITTQDDTLNEISLDSLGYIENTEQNNQQQTDIVQNVKHEEKEETTPQLFSEEEGADSFKRGADSENESESLINVEEEEDFEIPAFLRKQKN
jgi:cell division protein FtsZ